ncbi:hypothetical protein WJX84_000656 [Apatococcus fuscideae]|uniref:Uncharacterized protein n=1 Tax=Apatococcus fuscideae TaxID=2026836 RepID=A0AAW1SSQ7_9CHLO
MDAWSYVRLPSLLGHICGSACKYDVLSYSPTVSAVLKLVRKGYVHFSGLELRPQPAVKGVRIGQCD